LHDLRAKPPGPSEPGRVRRANDKELGDPALLSRSATAAGLWPACDPPIWVTTGLTAVKTSAAPMRPDQGATTHIDGAAVGGAYSAIRRRRHLQVSILRGVL
jgi:hypothetical protein